MTLGQNCHRKLKSEQSCDRYLGTATFRQIARAHCCLYGGCDPLFPCPLYTHEISPVLLVGERFFASRALYRVATPLRLRMERLRQYPKIRTTLSAISTHHHASFSMLGKHLACAVGRNTDISPTHFRLGTELPAPPQEEHRSREDARVPGGSLSSALRDN